MKKLTSRPAMKTLKFIREFWLEFDCCPSYREIKGHFRLQSINSVTGRINTLVRHGLVRREIRIAKGERTSILLVEQDTNKCPLCGQVKPPKKDSLTEGVILKNRQDGRSP